MTRHLIILVAFILFTSISFGQSISQTDSLLIMSKVKSVFSCFRNPDFSEFEKLSTEKIYCIICFNKPDNTDTPYMLGRRKFFDSHLLEISQSDPFIRAINSNNIFFIKEKDQITDITVFFTIYKKDELAPGHEGGQLGMYFRKVNNVYKFAGIETVP